MNSSHFVVLPYKNGAILEILFFVGVRAEAKRSIVGSREERPQMMVGKNAKVNGATTPCPLGRYPLPQPKQGFLEPSSKTRFFCFMIRWIIWITLNNG